MARQNRDDLSKFLVHLTRDYDNASAQDNLVSILKARLIKARNYHCLFKYDIDNVKLNFTAKLKGKFKTVCFTETPLPQINNLTSKIQGRSIELKAYGLVFQKDFLIQEGANPAIYINSKGTDLKTYLLSEFRSIFSKIRSYKKLIKAKKNHYDAIIQYFSLINIIDDNHDFSWEREWRYIGNLRFDYQNIVAIIAEEPDEFESYCKLKLNRKQFGYLKMIPIIAPDWGYEEIVEQMSIKIWNNAIS